MKISDLSIIRAAVRSLALIVAATGSARADAVHAWNEALMQFFATAGAEIPPAAEVRACAMMHLAIEEAIHAMGGGARPIGAPDDDLQAAAIAAAAETLRHTLPEAAERFGAMAAVELRALVGNPAAHARAIEAGHRAAEMVVRKRDHDGWRPPGPSQSALAALSMPLVPSSQLTSREPTSPWRDTTPFVLKKAAQFAVDPAYWKDMEGNVLENAGLSRARIFDHVDRATPPDVLMQFWSESPLVAWNRIARTTIERAGLDLASRARVLAIVNLAIADATLASLHWQFIWGHPQAYWSEAWVPTVGEPQATDVAAQIDGFSEPLMVRAETRGVVIPPVRNYPGLGAAVAGAAGAALAGAISGPSAAIEFPAAKGVGAATTAPGLSRRFASLAAAARECAYVSSLGGRDTREGCVAGYRLGESIGKYVTKQMRAQRR